MWHVFTPGELKSEDGKIQPERLPQAWPSTQKDDLWQQKLSFISYAQSQI